MIEALLKELVSSVKGATGALIVAVDGEAVQFGTDSISERLRLRGAYAAVVMQTFRAGAARSGMGRLKHVVVEYNGSILVAHEIDEDCSVVLELESGAGVGPAVYQSGITAAKLLREIAT